MVKLILADGTELKGFKQNGNNYVSKTENGALESRAGWKGLCRKGVSLLVVLVACRLDLITGTNFIRDAVVIAFVANETISIVENAGLMGINIPPAITAAIEVLKKKSDTDSGAN